MQTSLRKMGNSTGMIVPRALLTEIGATTGTAMDVRVEDGRLIATPISSAPREGWADDAAAIGGADGESKEWQEFANAGDVDLTW